MIRFNAALKTILGSVETIASENLRLTAALGRVLAEDIYVDSDIPGFDNSAMDGFAVKSSDTLGASTKIEKIETATIFNFTTPGNPLQNPSLNLGYS